MTNFGILATVVATTLTAGTLALAAPALAAPTETSAAQDTISSLRDEGYTVIVQNPNNTPLSEATVVDVRQGPEHVVSYENSLDQDVERVEQSIVFVDVR